MKITEMQTEDGEYKLILRSPKENLFGLLDKAGNRKSSKSDDWEYEPSPSNREDKWIDEHSFTLEEGILELNKLDRATKNGRV